MTRKMEYSVNLYNPSTVYNTLYFYVYMTLILNYIYKKKKIKVTCFQILISYSRNILHIYLN